MIALIILSFAIGIYFYFQFPDRMDLNQIDHQEINHGIPMKDLYHKEY